MGRHAETHTRIGAASRPRRRPGWRESRSAGVGVVVVLAFTSLAAVGAGAATAPATAACAALGVGARGPAVAAIQRAVGTRADGDFGPLTKVAVTRWQRLHGLRRSGVVDAATWRAFPALLARTACGRPVRGPVMAAGGSGGVAPSCATLTVGSVGPAVRVLQAVVGAAPDGEFGPRTLAAVNAAQRRLRLPVTGKVAAATWAALRLTGTPVCVTPTGAPSAASGPAPTASTAPNGVTPSPSPTAVAAPAPPPDAAAQAVIRAQVATLAAALSTTPGTTTDPIALQMLAVARAQTGKPYQWGGAGPGSYDCSGLVMASYRAAGLTLPRAAVDQYGVGVAVALDHAQQGDLLFYASDVARPATIYHVAIYVGRGTVLDAPYTGAYVGTRALSTRDLLPVAVRPAALLALPVGPGATGWTVSQLQQALVRGGARLAVDGADGPLTTQAVTAWQTAHKLPATGVVDVTTWLTLH